MVLCPECDILGVVNNNEIIIEGFAFKKQEKLICKTKFFVLKKYLNMYY